MLSDALTGVIIGGLIGSITPVVTLVAENKRWKKVTKIEHLRLKRDKLEKAFDGIPEQLGEAVKNGSYPTYMASDFYRIFPPKVSDAFSELIHLPGSASIQDKKDKVFSIYMAMKASLAEIDESIEEAMDD